MNPENVTYQNIVERLLHQSPEFASSEYFNPQAKDDGWTYLAIGDFGDFFLSATEQPNMDDLTERMFTFLNEVYNDNTIPPDSASGDTIQKPFFILKILKKKNKKKKKKKKKKNKKKKKKKTINYFFYY